MGPNDKSQNVGPNDVTGSESPPAGVIQGLHENHADSGVPFEAGSPNGGETNSG